MIRRVALLLAGLLASPVMGGHFTHDRIIGFSEEGRYFAFETYGLQRGSGLPFSEVFVVDLEQNAWVTGTPVSASRGETSMAEVEAAPFLALDATRTEAWDNAQPVLRGLAIHRPATVLYAAGLGQAYQAPQVTPVTIPNPDFPMNDPWGAFSVRLTDVEVPAAVGYCARPEDLRGYRLEVLLPDGSETILHEDQRIPASRGCAQTYRLDAVVSAGFPQDDTPLVALISAWQQGFEGLARHVIAAPLPALGRMQPDQDFDTVLAGFMAGTEPTDPDSLVESLRARQQPDPSALRFPDADLPAMSRAVELFAAQHGFPSHGRIFLSERQVVITPEGAGGPTTLSLVRLQAHNLGQARRDEVAEFFGEDAVGPPEAFGVGPDVEWRFVMRPLQGMRADVVAAGHRTIEQGEAQECGPSPCRSAAALNVEARGLACNSPAAPVVTGTATRLGGELAGLVDQNNPADWLVEHGLWQDDATQIVAVTAGQPTACWMTFDSPD